MIIWAQRLFSYYIMMSFLCTAYAIYLETGMQERHQVLEIPFGIAGLDPLLSCLLGSMIQT